MLFGKKIVLGITGSIAAYKSATLARLLIKEGAEVQVVMTPSSRDFISPLTFSALTNRPVVFDFVSDDRSLWNSHVDIAKWADALLIAPATAHTISSMTAGSVENVLLAVYLSASCPVFVAPAMDLDMWKHSSTRENISKIISSGIIIIPPGKGELASGLVGEGRMEEPENIVKALEDYFRKNSPLSGLKALVTAGSTHEAIDPVRFIGNSSSGKMGYAIAETLAGKGAEVTLVTGPVSIHSNNPSIRLFKVNSAAEMLRECNKHFPDSDITVMTAAVADFTPATPSSEKLKKVSEVKEIKLIPTKDILKEMGEKKRKNQFLAGFALESENELENGMMKLKSKNLDLVVINSTKEIDSGINSDYNKITLIDRFEQVNGFPRKPKKEVALDIVQKIISMIK